MATLKERVEALEAMAHEHSYDNTIFTLKERQETAERDRNWRAKGYEREASALTGKSVHGQLCCSFCGKKQREVKKLIAGPTVYICNECVVLCAGILEKGE